MLRTILPLAVALVAAPAVAASPFDGTWKTDFANTKFSTTPDVIKVANGTYDCSSCLPPLKVHADGKFHAVTGRPYTDMVSVTVVSPNEIVMRGQKGGKPVYETTLTISPDGKTATYVSSRTNLATGVKTSGTSTSTRVGPVPASGSKVSGSWRTTEVKQASENSTTQTFKVSGDTFTLTTPTGEGYTATFGGPPVVQKNDVGKTMVAVKRLAANHVVETDTRDGKTIAIYDMTVAPDGRTMKLMATDPRNGSVDMVAFTKQ